MRKSQLTQQTIKEVGPLTFKTLMERVKCDTGDDVDSVGFSSSAGPFYISFYGELADNHQLIVEDFGMMYKGKFIEIEPTEDQRGEMLMKLLSRVYEINNMEPEVIELQENYGIYGKYY